ncbi:MAG TPA: redoxin domain-containing protein [Candidatus Thermoplasmatota archaeon]|nr:redoxin domain-containing protein [Candidatus Thermoplasmatota archaeon]
MVSPLITLSLSQAALKVGDRLPDFKVRAATQTDLVDFSTADALGKGPVVWAFYPLAFTSVCTAEVCELRDTLGRFSELNARVYGVSIDTPQTNRIFAQKENLNFPLVSDPNREMVPKFGIVADMVAGVKHVAKRAVYVSDSEGRIVYAWVSEDPKARPDFEQVRAALRNAK